MTVEASFELIDITSFDRMNQFHTHQLSRFGDCCERFDHNLVTFIQAFLDKQAAEGKGNARRLSTRIDPRQVTIVAWVRDNVQPRPLTT